MNTQPNLTPRKINSRKFRDLSTIFHLKTIKEDFDNVIGLINANLAKGKTFEVKKQTDFAKDLYRYQIAFLLSGFDYSIHCMMKNKAEKMFNGIDERTDIFLNYQICFEDIITAIESNNIDKPDWLINFLNFKISTETYLDLDKFKKALNYMKNDLFNLLIQTMYPGVNHSKAISTFNNSLTQLFKRRHAIVHQNDRLHSSGSRQDITYGYVIDQKDFIEKLFNSLVMLIL